MSKGGSTLASSEKIHLVQSEIEKTSNFRAQNQFFTPFLFLLQNVYPISISDPNSNSHKTLNVLVLK